MSSQLREAVVSLFSAFICFSIYFYYMLDAYDDGVFAGIGATSFVGKSVFYLIVLSIVVTIVCTIIMAIVTSIITGENEKDLVDERDRLISLRGMQVSFITFSFGFLMVMAAMAWMGTQAVTAIIYLICTMFLCTLAGEFTKLFHYIRGL